LILLFMLPAVAGMTSACHHVQPFSIEMTFCRLFFNLGWDHKDLSSS
jgi:hypothetical protein